MIDIETHHLECACGSAEHDLRIGLDPDDGSIWIEVQLRVWRPWYQRLWLAVHYVLGMQCQCRYGAYDCTELQRKDYRVIRELLDRSEATLERIASGD